MADAPEIAPIGRAALARLRRTLRQRLQHGCVRAVFSRPGDDAEPDVVELHGSWDEAALSRLLERAEQAAGAGRVKQVYVLDATTQIRIDARHGYAKRHSLDEAKVQKVMGGKDRMLRPDRSADFLRVIGIANPDGSISAKKAKKYKQINHFVEVCRPVWERLHADASRSGAPPRPLRIVDLGCGNAYLTLALAEALRIAEIEVVIVGVDRRTDVIERSRARATALGFANVHFHEAAIAEHRETKPVDLVLALHACDTATDEALAFAIEARAGAVLVAPCCQAELAAALEDAHASPVPALSKQPLLRREYGALLTDALRVEALHACGYRVDTLEFVGSEHTPKNLLLRAVLVREGASDLGVFERRCEALGLRPHLLTLLRSAQNRGRTHGPET